MLSAYLHQSYQRRHGCNILQPQHLLLPGSTNSHSELLCISAYSLNTWPASGEIRGESRQRGKTHQCCREDHEIGRDGRESLEKQALEKLIIIICIKWHSQAHT